MKTFTRTTGAFTTLIITLLVTSYAQAEYRLTAYPDGRGYRSIASEEPVEALQSFSSRRPSRLDFLDLNNLCVTQIMVGDLSDAIESCEASLEKLASYRAVSVIEKHDVEASIYSNLAVARAKSGDFEGASADLEVALRINFQDENARANMEQISQNLVANN